MASKPSEFDLYQVFTQSLNHTDQNPPNEQAWNVTILAGLAWIVLRVESDLVPLGPDSGYGHLFCDKGLRACQLKEDAKSPSITYPMMMQHQSFLLSLIRFRPRGPMQTWRQTYQKCINHCQDCVVGHDACLSLLKDKWLPMHHPANPEKISTFLTGIYNYFISMTSSAIQDANALGYDACSTGNLASSALIPPLTIILSKPQILTSSAALWQQVTRIMASQLVSGPIKAFHPHLTLPGFILLSMSDDMDCAGLARNQLEYFASQESSSSVPPGPSEAIASVMVEVMKILTRDHIKSSSGTELQFIRGLVIHPTRENSWLSLASILKALPFSKLASSSPPLNQVTPAFFGLPKIILDQITDCGEHLPQIYSCWGILLRQIQSSFWSAMHESPDNSSSLTSTTAASPPQALQRVFESEHFLSNLSSPDFVDRCLQWLLPFIQSATDSNEFLLDSFNLLQQTLVVELQHAPVETGMRIGAANLALAIWQELLRQQALLNPPPTLQDSVPNASFLKVVTRTCIQQSLQGFLPFFIDLAYHAYAQTGRWGPPQSKAQEIIEQITIDEVQNLAVILQYLGKIRLQIDTNTQDPRSVDLSKLDIRISKPLWIKIYGIANDHSETNPFLLKVFSLLIRSLSGCAHIDTLAQKSWLPPGNLSNSLFEPTVTALNNAIWTARAPLVDALIDLSRSNYGTKLLSVLMSEPSVMKATIVLIFSPNDGLHMSSLALVRQWADCTSRLDCLRVLLLKGQKAVFEGLKNSLRTVDLHAIILPDAMSLARRFVRCMTDVIEILCSRTDGLLRNPNFVGCLNAYDLVQIWALMCSSVSSIFTRTAHWAAFWQTSQMTDWMQDALIFAEQLVQEFQTFETVASGRFGDHVSEIDDLRSRMVDSFMKPTESLTNWLRLTNPDLLDRSTRVLVQMLEKIAKFKRPLKPHLVDRLASYIDPDKAEKKHIGLTDQQCVYIKTALATHPDLADRFSTIIEDDDEETELLDSGGALGSINTVYRKQERIHDPDWVHIFPQMNSLAGASAQKKGLPHHGQSQFANAYQSLSQHSSTHQVNNVVGSSKPTTKKIHATSSLMNTLRLKATRPISHKARPPLVRPSQVTHSPAFPKPRRPSGPNFGQPPMRNFQSNQANKSQVPAGSSSDDDSEDGNPEATGLAGLVNAQKVKTFQSRKLAEPQRRIKMYDDPALEKHQKTLQAKRERQNLLKIQKLKMQPDFTSLHRFILQWDYNHNGSCPPNSPAEYSTLPPVFNSFSHYLSCLEPLLMCESWQQICQAKESVIAGEKTPIPCEVIGRTSVDDFVELYTSIKHGFLPDRTHFTEADLVLIRSHDPQSHSRCILAKVISMARKPEWFELNLRVNFGNATQDIRGNLVPKTKWDVIHLCSLSTTHREWAALRSLPYLSLGNDILEAYVTPPAPIPQERLAEVVRYQQVNEPQARAIISALDTPGFSLIQGPPGTGKTSTIIGLVGAFIAGRPDVSVPPGGTPSVTKKILLCAPSNAAVDEVAKRLKEGVRGSHGQLIIPKLVRIGADSKVNLAVKDIFIDELVEVMSKGSEPGKAAETLMGAAGVIQDLRQQITELRDTRDSRQMEAEKLPQESPDYRVLQEEVSNIRRKIHELSAKIDQARDQHDSSKRFLDAATKKLRMQILQDADVVCSTLSGSGHDYMSQLPFDFETVVIDEACQCVEPASLIPLRYNATQCILVGDPMQLPPTVLSQTASRAGYDQSLFVRMQRNAPDVAHLLSIQYRMHPAISVFPSTAFYGSRLLDGPEMDKKAAQPWHESGSLFPPYAFYHPVGAREERGAHHSLLNRTEASLAVAIYWRIVHDYPSIDFAYRVGIITGYSAQVGEIRRQLRAKFPANAVATIDVNTVDGFQGQEKDIIILSCVRAGKEDSSGSNGGIGFLKDIRRMNVALTRAKSSMFIIGNHTFLSQDPTWKLLVEDASQRGAISEVTSQSFYSTSTIPVVSNQIKNKSNVSKIGPPKALSSDTQSQQIKRLNIQSALSNKSTDSQSFIPNVPSEAASIPEQGTGSLQADNTITKLVLPLKRNIPIDDFDQRPDTPNDLQLEGPQAQQVVDHQQGASSGKQFRQPLPEARPSRDAHPGPSGPGPARKPIPVHCPRQRTKPMPQIFITKPKGPPNHQFRPLHHHGVGPRSGANNDGSGTGGDNRSVRQRIQDQHDLIHNPRRP